MQAILALLLMVLPLGGAAQAEGHAGSPTDPGAPPPQAVPYPGGYFGQAETTDVSLENFRFCVRMCQRPSVGYVRSPAGPIPGTDNPRAVVYMQKGAPVTWTYRDIGCDLVRCSGHDIRIEDGTASGRQVGLVTAETGHDSLAWTIPADAEPETIIRYFCARHATFGMTGAFQVLPIRVLSVSYPRSV